MSSYLQNMVGEHYPVGGTKKLVLLALADAASGGGCFYPSLPAVARFACTSDKNVRQIIRELIHDGVLLDMGVQSFMTASGPRPEHGYSIIPLDGWPDGLRVGL